MPKGKASKKTRTTPDANMPKQTRGQENTLTARILQNTQVYLEKELKKYEDIKVMYD